MANPIVQRRRGPKPQKNEAVLIEGRAEVRLNRGATAVLDEADYPLVEALRWSAQKISEVWYAVAFVYTPEGKRRQVLMHRYILGLVNGDGKKVDHADGNGLNNQRSNLRLATTAENAWNRRKRRIKSSRYKGVRFAKWLPAKPWRGHIFANGKLIHLGYFATEEEAARAYNEAATQHYGEFACLNEIGIADG